MRIRLLLISLLAVFMLAGCMQESAPAAPATPTAPNYSAERMNGTQIIPPPQTQNPARALAAKPNNTPAAPTPLPQSEQAIHFKQPQLEYGAEQTVLKRAMEYRALCENESMDIGTHIITLTKADTGTQPLTFSFEMVEARNGKPYARLGIFSLQPGEYQRVSIADGPDYAIVAKYDDSTRSGSACIGVTVYNMSAG